MNVYAVLQNFEEGVWVSFDEKGGPSDKIFLTMELAEAEKARLDEEARSHFDEREKARQTYWQRRTAARTVLEANGFEGADRLIPVSEVYEPYTFESDYKIVSLEVEES